MSSQTITLLICDVCKRDETQVVLTATWASKGPPEIRCEFCQGLLDAGLIRPEMVDGVLRFRQWFPEWKPGKLVGDA